MSEICVPGALGRLRESDPVIFEALCLKECLGRIGLVGASVRECTANILNPGSTMFPEHTAPDQECVCLRVTGEKYVNEVEVLQATQNGKIHESGVDQTRKIEALLAVGPLRGTASEFPARWARAEDTLHAAMASEFIPMLRESKSLRSIVRLAEMLHKKGFQVRR